MLNTFSYCCSVTQSCLSLWDPLNCSTVGFPVLHYLLEFAQTHVHWVSDTIQPFHPLSPPSPVALSLTQHQGLFQWLTLCIRWPKYWSFTFSISPSNKYSGLISFRIVWFDLLAVQVTLKSLLQHHSSKASILQCSTFFMVHLSHPYMTTGKTIALTIQTFVGKVMSLLFNTLFRFVLSFFPRNKSLNFMAAVTIHSDSGAQENKICHCCLFFPIYLPWSDGTRCWDLHFLNVEFLSQLSHSPLSLSSRDLVVLCFLPLKWYHLHILGFLYFSQQSWFQLVSHPAWHLAWCI